MYRANTKGVVIALLVCMVGLYFCYEEVRKEGRVEEEFRKTDAVSPKVSIALKEIGYVETKRYLQSVSSEFPEYYYYDGGERFVHVVSDDSPLGDTKNVKKVLYLAKLREYKEYKEPGLWVVNNALVVQKLSFTDEGIIVFCFLDDKEDNSSPSKIDCFIPWKIADDPKSGIIRISGELDWAN